MAFIKGKAVISELQDLFLYSTTPCGNCQHLECNKYGIIFAASVVGYFYGGIKAM